MLGSARLSLLGLLPLAFLAAACAGPSGSEDLGTDSVEITKRVNPNAGTAGFELGRPQWDVEPFARAQTFRFDTVSVGFGQVVERAAGQFSLQQTYTLEGHIYLASRSVPLTLGFISIYTPAGVRVGRTKPVTFGAIADRFQLRDASHRPVLAGPLTAPHAALMFDGTYALISEFEEPRSIVVREGERKDITLPVTTVHFAFDPIHDDYPGESTCKLTLRRSSGSSLTENVELRAATPLVVPAGSRAKLAICNDLPIALPEDGEVTVRMNRLEVNHVAVTSPDGTNRLVPGTYTVERLGADGTASYRFNPLPTRTAVDVPDGSYRVTSVAPNAPAHVVTVSFP